MACLTPIILKSAKGSRERYATEKVPCGKCPNCTKRRRSQWVFRLLQEQKVAESSAFITYTYADENLPLTKNGLPTLVKSEHQLFMKRLRDHLKRNKIETKLKYYAVGEYGSLTQRPHYHSILFNLPRLYLDSPEILTNLWQKGFVRIDPCTPGSIAYVAGYCMKKLYSDNQARAPDDDRIPEFSNMSKGMGKSFITSHMVDYLKEHLNPYLIREGGIKMPIPRYYRDKIFTEKEKNIIAAKARSYMEENPPYKDFKQEFEVVKNAFKQREKLIIDKRSKI